MLTKNLLRHTTRQGKIFPKYIDPSHSEYLEMAGGLLSVFSQNVGQSIKTLETALKDYPGGPVGEGFKKLLLDRCQLSDKGFAEVEEKRWEILRKSKQLRSQYQFRTRESFFERMAEGESLGHLQESLYGDLPHNRLIASFDAIEADKLIHRYNVAQIQGLLLFAQKVRCSVYGPSLVEKRRLMQKIKFHGLLLETSAFKGHSDPLTFELSGPLSIYDGSSTYGGRLANFFPHLLNFKRWDVSAMIKWEQKRLTLEVSHKKAMKSHYQSLTGYIPEEFKAFMDRFKAQALSKKLSWKVSLANDFIDLGANEISFPDFSFQHSDGRTMYLELFHRWHSSAVKKRLRSIENPSSPLIVGICKSLLKDKEIKQMVDKGLESKRKIVTYSSFPTTKALLTYLN